MRPLQFSLLLVLSLIAPFVLQAQPSDEPTWLREMPTVDEVRQSVRSVNAEQTLVWQGAVLTNLLLGKDFPAAYTIAPPAGYGDLVRGLKERYKEGIRAVEQEYSRNVRSLDNAENRRQFTLMCSADGARVNSRGEREGPTVPKEMWLGLLKPSVRAIVQSSIDRREASGDAAAARKAKREQAERGMFLEGARVIGSMAVSVLAGIACFVFAGRISRPVRKARFERTNNAGVQEFSDFETMESVRRAEAARLALAKVLVGVGVLLLLVGPFLFLVMEN